MTDDNEENEQVFFPHANKGYVAKTIEEIKRLRYWFDGFKAAGGRLPQSEQTISPLLKSQHLLEEYLDFLKKIENETPT